MFPVPRLGLLVKPKLVLFPDTVQPITTPATVGVALGRSAQHKPVVGVEQAIKN